MFGAEITKSFVKQQIKELGSYKCFCQVNQNGPIHFVEFEKLEYHNLDKQYSFSFSKKGGWKTVKLDDVENLWKIG